MKRIAKRDIINRAHINATTATHATYFPFMEYTERVAYSAGVYGWTGNLFRGCTSGCLYAVTDYGNENAPTSYRLMEMLGNRERAVMETLDHVEEVEYKGAEYSVLRFVAMDGHAFTVATFDFGKTWEICG